MNQIRRLDQVKASLVVERRELEKLAQQVKDEVELVHQPNDPDIRRGREAQLVETRSQWSRKNAEVQQLASEEATMSQDAASEQSRWTDFNQRLEELERALARR